MDFNLSANPRELRVFNLRRYKGIPPSWELIEKTIKKSKIKFMERFEAAFGIPKKTLVRHRIGDRSLPPIYWHIFYDFDNLDRFYKEISSQSGSHMSSNNRSHKVTTKQLDNNKNILNALSTRVKG